MGETCTYRDHGDTSLSFAALGLSTFLLDSFVYFVICNVYVTGNIETKSSTSHFTSKRCAFVFMWIYFLFQCDIWWISSSEPSADWTKHHRVECKCFVEWDYYCQSTLSTSYIILNKTGAFKTFGCVRVVLFKSLSQLISLCLLISEVKAIKWKALQIDGLQKGKHTI